MCRVSKPVPSMEASGTLGFITRCCLAAFTVSSKSSRARREVSSRLAALWKVVKWGIRSKPITAASDGASVNKADSLR